MNLVVPATLDGERADKIFAVLAGVSRSAARAAFDDGAVTRGGEPVAPSERLAAGTQLVGPDIEDSSSLEPDASVAFSILYEDHELAVIDKPAGVVVHPGAGVRSGTLAAGLVARWPQLQNVGPSMRPGIVHRLDRDTSGALIVAKTETALQALQRELAARRIHRTYTALVEGVPAAATGRIDAPIGRDPRRPVRRAVIHTGKAAITMYSVIDVWAGPPRVALLDVELETGRTHQIRVHMESIGHPIVGDPMYGRGGPPGRPFLHARQIAFRHPAGGRPISVEARLPADLATHLRALGEPAAAGSE